MKLRLAILLGLLATLLFGCAGGGGGGTTLTNVIGAVLWIETGGPTNPATTVRIGDASTTTDLGTGGFSLDVPTGVSELTATFAQNATSNPIVRTFAFPPVTASTDLGDFYIGPEEVTVTGRLVDSGSGAPVVGALVTLAGRRTTSDSTGTFALAQVAYSSSNLSVFLGLQGQAQATGYFTQNFSPPSAAVGGVVSVGDIAMVPEASTTPPPLPFNLTGLVTPSNLGAGALVEVLVGASVVRTGFADGSGRFQFWVPVGTYTVRATQGASTGSSPANVVNVNQTVTANVTIN